MNNKMVLWLVLGVVVFYMLSKQSAATKQQQLLAAQPTQNEVYAGIAGGLLSQAMSSYDP